MSFNSNSTQLLWSELNQTHELNELTHQLIFSKKGPKYTSLIATLFRSYDQHMTNMPKTNA